MDLSDSTVRRRVNKAFREHGTLSKVCGKCFAVKGHDDFPRRASSPDGRGSQCRPCNSATASAWVAEHPDARKRTKAQSYQRNKEHASSYQRQWRATNAQRHAENGRRWRSENPERNAANHRRWWTNNPDAAREYQHRRRAIVANSAVQPFTARDLRHDWEGHDLWSCFFCGGSLAAGYEVEHFYPLSKGGPHALFNLVPSCTPCNRGAGGKGTKEPWGFLRESLAEQDTDLDACLASLEAVAARRR
ncbi:HNH endonuclease [Streptomyces sp. NPDC002491]